MMLPRSATAPRKRNAPRPAWKVADAFRKWLRGRPCACKGRNPDCGGDMVAAHVDHAGGKGTGTDGSMGKKPSDRWTISLCKDCHQRQHAMGETTFEIAYGIDMKKLAEAFYRASPHRGKLDA